jgi:tetratricopeptide (TPR) repeat protein/predicted HTH domain antitoxin
MHSKVSFRPIDDSSDDDESVPMKKKTTRNLFRVITQNHSGDSKFSKTIQSSPIPSSHNESSSEPNVVTPNSNSSTPIQDNNRVSANDSNSSIRNTKSKQSSSFPFSFRGKTKERVNSKVQQSNVQLNAAKDSTIHNIADDEEDPVMALFQARTTQRVRFNIDVESVEGDSNQPGTVNTDKSDTDIENVDTKEDNNLQIVSKDSNNTSSNSLSFNVKKFMKNALFGNNADKVSKAEIDEFEKEVRKEIETAAQDVTDDNEGADMQNIEWTHSAATDKSGTRLSVSDSFQASPYMEDGKNDEQPFLSSFEEDHETRAAFLKLLNKARRAQYVYYRYQYAVRTYIKALDLLKSSFYPDSHPAVVKTMKSLNNAYFAVSSLKNSANIVKLGIKYEDSGELVRALKMYTVAYRIRRDNLSATHPSLVVLLNMLGSIQIKRGELQEAMAIYELALKDSGPSFSVDGPTEESCSPPEGESSEQSGSKQVSPMGNFLTRSVAYREMGTIYQEWGEIDRALHCYHKSLDCMAHHKGISETFENPLHSHRRIKGSIEQNNTLSTERQPQTVGVKSSGKIESPFSGGEMFFSSVQDDDDTDAGGMELTFKEAAHLKADSVANTAKKGSVKDSTNTTPSNIVKPSCYDVFFPLKVKGKSNKSKSKHEQKGDLTDVDIAQTIHRIAQLYRSEEQYDIALPIFFVALRGMKQSLGKTDPNVAAILGNIGNLQKEMGDMDAAYHTYQQVLAIESYRLGLSHPDVVITLHNIATIDAARGNLEHAMALYKQVISLQRKLFGEEHESVAVTSACMGDVYERTGDAHAALECYEEALRITIFSLGRHSIEVARLLHKLGKLAVTVVDYHLALSYLSKAALVYRLNKLRDDDEWVIDAARDAADVEASIAMGRGVYFEC